MAYYAKYLKYKNKYLHLKQQSGGVLQCLNYGFRQHLGECWHDSLSMLLMQSDKTNEEYIEKCKFLNTKNGDKYDNLDRVRENLKILFSPEKLEHNAYLLPYSFYSFYLKNKTNPELNNIINKLLELSYIYIKYQIGRVINRINYDDELKSYDPNKILISLKQGRSLLYKLNEEQLDSYIEEFAKEKENDKKIYEELLQKKQEQELLIRNLQSQYDGLKNPTDEEKNLIILENQKSIFLYITNSQSAEELYQFMQIPFVQKMLVYKTSENVNDMFQTIKDNLNNLIINNIANYELTNQDIIKIQKKISHEPIELLKAKHKLIKDIKQKPEETIVSKSIKLKRRYSTSCSINTSNLIHRIINLINDKKRDVRRSGGNITEKLLAFDLQYLYTIRLVEPKTYLSCKTLNKNSLKSVANTNYFINLLDNENFIGILFTTGSHVITLYSCNNHNYLYDNNLETGTVPFDWKQNIRSILQKNILNNNSDFNFIYIDEVDIFTKYGFDKNVILENKDTIIEYLKEKYNKDDLEQGIEVDVDFNREYATKNINKAFLDINTYDLYFIMKNTFTDVNPELDLNINHSNIFDQLNNFKILNFTKENIHNKENLPTYMINNYNKFSFIDMDLLLSGYYSESKSKIYKNIIDMIDNDSLIKEKMEQYQSYMDFKNSILQKFKENGDYLYAKLTDDFIEKNITSANFYLEENLPQIIIDNYELFKIGNFHLNLYTILNELLNVKSQKDINEFYMMLFLKLEKNSDIKKELEKNPGFVKYYDVYLKTFED
jgi:hypothetical protein